MINLNKIVMSWEILSSYLTKPKNEKELDRLIEFCDYLIDLTNGDKKHKLYSLLIAIGKLIHEYEIENIEEPDSNPIECLKFLMAEHNLKQKDLVEIGSPGVISEVMNGKRDLNKRQIQALSNRFKVKADLFF